MRYYTQQHPYYCGIDLHARPMVICIVDRDGRTLFHENRAVSADVLQIAYIVIFIIVHGFHPWTRR